MKKMNNEIELKPCPFCGEQPWFRTGSEHYFIGGWMNTISLECCITMDEGFGSYDTDKSKEEAKKDLIERWNKRTNT